MSLSTASDRPNIYTGFYVKKRGFLPRDARVDECDFNDIMKLLAFDMLTKYY